MKTKTLFLAILMAAFSWLPVKSSQATGNCAPHDCYSIVLGDFKECDGEHGAVFTYHISANNESCKDISHIDLVFDCDDVSSVKNGDGNHLSWECKDSGDPSICSNGNLPCNKLLKINKSINNESSDPYTIVVKMKNDDDCECATEGKGIIKAGCGFIVEHTEVPSDDACDEPNPCGNGQIDEGEECDYGDDDNGCLGDNCGASIRGGDHGENQCSKEECSRSCECEPCADSDKDGVCDPDDKCPGYDDRADEDQDGVPDGCDETKCGDDDPDSGEACGEPGLNCPDNFICQEESCDCCPDYNHDNACDECVKDADCKDDGQFCNGPEHCDEASRSCVSGPKPSCEDDGNDCTDDLCDPNANGGAGGCAHPNNYDSCDDEDPCTEHDQCSKGSCSGSPVDCGDPEGKCVEDRICQPDGAGGHECVDVYVEEGVSCGDGEPCDGNEVCDGQGNCVEGVPVICESKNPCQACVCDDGVGGEGETGGGDCVCSPVTDGTPCDEDGLDCNGVDSCQSGECVAGTPTDCDDNDGCTSDSCVESEGGPECSHSNIQSADCPPDNSGQEGPGTTPPVGRPSDPVLAQLRGTGCGSDRDSVFSLPSALPGPSIITLGVFLQWMGRKRASKREKKN